jgi:flagellar biosynthesis protein FlhA
MARAASSTLNFERLAGGSNVLNAVILLGVLGLMMMPVPSQILDVLLTFNITFALLIMLVTVYLREPLEFSVFPSVLLMVTLFRLALNVASTRLILSKGFAGEVINSFGNFVVAGNYVIGFVIFLILVIIQFVVITKGAGRIAEVAARFTLDAMPGKQMSIDADLGAGLITEADAKARREKISKEADFYGAMDGASKFVRGDAIAGIIITLVNIIGGLLIGIVQRGLSPTEAVHTYTLLTVGDGLVTQIPALIVSTAAGMVVTRSAGEADLGEEFTSQFLSYPKVFLIGSVSLCILGLVPGLPTLPFMLIAVACLAMFFTTRSMHARATARREAEEREEPVRTEPLEEDNLFYVDPLELEIGYGLIPLVDKTKGGDLLNRLTNLRKQKANELGIHVSPIRIRDNVQLKPNQYRIRLKGADVARGRVYPEHLLAMSGTGRSVDVPGIKAEEPVFGLPAVWISPPERQAAEADGYTIVEPEAVIATHLSEVIKKNAADIMTRQDVKELLEKVKRHAPAVVEELPAEAAPVGFIQRVLSNLLREQIPIRDMVTILETVSNFIHLSKDPDVISERVRESLARSISQLYAEGGVIHVFTLEPTLEDKILEAVRNSERSGAVALDPVLTSRLVKALAASAEKAIQEGHQPILACSSPVRLFLKRLSETTIPGLVVLSFNEVAGGVDVKSLGMVTVHE